MPSDDMGNKFTKDTLYAERSDMIVDFAFDEAVAQVFPDMIRRSVPGYDTIIALLGLFAEHYAQPGSYCYDLGCSLGASTLAMRRRIQVPGCRIIAVDNSQPMVEKCRAHIAQDDSTVPVDIVCADVCTIRIHQASLVVMNFILQFLEPGQRLGLLKNTYAGLSPGGAVIVSEKIDFNTQWERNLNEGMHRAFKQANGYSELEISQKRSALEKVLIPDTLEQHVQRLQAVGFTQIETWFRCFNFVSLLAIK